jgi:hypothetical protein
MVCDGVLSATPLADGTDQIADAYTAAMKAASKKAIHEHTTGGIKANVSKLRQIAKAAAKPTADFILTLDRVAAARLEAVGKKEKVRTAYASFVEAARTQCSQDDDLSDEQIVEAFMKPEPKEQTEEAILDRCAKALEDLVSGEKGVKSDSPLVESAMGLIRERHAEIVLLRERAEHATEAVRLGLVPAAPVMTDEERESIRQVFASNDRAMVNAEEVTQ